MRVAAGTYTTRGMLESRYEETINNDIQLYVQAHNNIPSIEEIKFPINKKSATQIFNQLRKGSGGEITGNNYVCSPVHIRRVRSALARLGFKGRKKDGS